MHGSTSPAEYNSGGTPGKIGDRMKLWWFFCIVPLLTTAALGQNGWNVDAQKCEDQSGDPAIEACTRAIASGELSQANLARTYQNRGVEWRHKGDDDRAMADYNQALGLDSGRAYTYNDRGNVWVDKGEYDRAIADYDQAVRLYPNYAGAYYNRGVAHFVRGDWAAAAGDFTRNHELDPKGDYALLWLALAGMHQPDSGWEQRLEAAAQGLSQDWPMPLLRLYEGQITADQMLAAAGDMTAQPGRLCEVGFFLGEWKLAHGQTQEAAANLKTAQSACAHDLAEYTTAIEELKKLGGQ